MKPYTPDEVLARAARTLTAHVGRNGIDRTALILCELYERWYAEAVARTAVA